MTATSSEELLGGFIEEIDVKRIDLSQNSLREELGPLSGLVASISQIGLLQPIVVRPVNQRFEVIAGARRLNCCKTLGIRKIPCHVVHLDDKEAFEVALMENIQRETLSPVEEARAFKKYVETCGYGSVSELARKIGKSQEYVSQRLRILNLPEDVLDKLRRRLITPSHAVEMLSLERDEQTAILELAMENCLSSREIRVIARKTKRDNDAMMPQFLQPLETNETEATSKALRKCITLMEITLARLDAVIERLGEKSWIAREAMMFERQVLHRQIDDLLYLNKKLRYSDYARRMEDTIKGNNSSIGSRHSSGERSRCGH